MSVDSELLNLFKLRDSDGLSIRDRKMVDVAIEKRVIYLGHRYSVRSNSRTALKPPTGATITPSSSISKSKCDCNAKSSAHSVFCPAHPGNHV